MLPTTFQFIWPSGFRGEDLNKYHMQFLFLLNSEEIKILNFEWLHISTVSLQWIVNQDIILMALHVLLVVTVHTSQSMLWYLDFYYYHWVDLRYFYNWKLKFLNNVIIYKTLTYLCNHPLILKQCKLYFCYHHMIYN
jgi:hypothetical protein